MTCKRCHQAPATIQPYWTDEIELCGHCATAVARLLDQHDKWPPVPWDDEEASR
jgi:protein-arginine kinase activator protein McsA